MDIAFTRARTWAADGLRHRAFQVVDPLEVGQEHSPLVQRSRVKFHLLLRPLTRVLLARNAIRGRTGMRRNAILGLALAGCGYDLVEAMRLHRNPRVRTVGRSLADAVELSIWPLITTTSTGLPAILACPTITEAAILYGAPAASLPAAQMAIGATTARLVGRPFDPMCYATQAAALVGGFGFRGIEINRSRQLRGDLDAEMARRQEDLARQGRYRVATARFHFNGHNWETPHDVINNSRHFFSGQILGEASPLRQVLNGRKAKLHDELVEHDTWDLFQAFRLAKQAINDGSDRTRPEDQIDDPTFLEPDQALHAVSSAQAQQLIEEMASSSDHGEFRYRGSPHVLVVSGERPGTRVVLTINERRVVLAADPVRDARSVWRDPIPAAAAMGVVWALADATRVFHNVRLRWAFPGAASFLGLSAWSSLRMSSRGREAHNEIVLASAVVGAVHTIAVTRGLEGRSLRPDGLLVLPAEIGMKAPSLLLGFAWKSLTTPQRIAALTAHGAVTGIALARAGSSRRSPQVILLLGWNVAALLASASYRNLIDKTTADLETIYRERSAALAHQTAATYEVDEWRLVARAARESRERLPVKYRQSEIDTTLKALEKHAWKEARQ